MPFGETKTPSARGSGSALVSASPRGVTIHGAAPPPSMYRTIFGRFKIVTVQADYLECHSYALAPDGTATEGTSTIYVAKPYPLRGGGGSYSAGDIIVAARNNSGGVGELTAGGEVIGWEDVVSAGGGGASVADTTSVIVAETATPGTAATAMRSDAILGLKIYATKPGLQFVGASGGLGVIWGVYGNMSDITDAANSVGTRGTLVHTDHHHHLATDSSLAFSAGTLGVDWSDWPMDNDTIYDNSGQYSVDFSKFDAYDGDFSMGGGTLSHSENATEPIYSTGTGLGLRIGDGLKLTGVSGSKTLEVSVDGTTIGINGSGELYVI